MSNLLCLSFAVEIKFPLRILNVIAIYLFKIIVEALLKYFFLIISKDILSILQEFLHHGITFRDILNEEPLADIRKKLGDFF